jgi:hypothetical protein
MCGSGLHLDQHQPSRVADQGNPKGVEVFPLVVVGGDAKQQMHCHLEESSKTPSPRWARCLGFAIVWHCLMGALAEASSLQPGSVLGIPPCM